MVANSKNTERIVSAAMELFAQQSYASVMVKDICQAAGVSHSSFYSVFTGKDEILLYILRGYKDDFEGTMRLLLDKDSDLEKLWMLCAKYLSLAESFGPDLMAAMFSLELRGKLDLTLAIHEYADKYMDWFVRFARNCQATGIIRNQGSAESLVPIGMKLTFFIVYEWCISKGVFALRDQAIEALEAFYDIDPAYRGVRP